MSLRAVTGVALAQPLAGELRELAVKHYMAARAARERKARLAEEISDASREYERALFVAKQAAAVAGGEVVCVGGGEIEIRGIPQVDQHGRPRDTPKESP